MKSKAYKKNFNYKQLKITGGNKAKYDFSDFKTFKELFRHICYRNMSINEAEKNKMNLMQYSIV